MVKREEPTIKKAEDVLEYLRSLDEIRRYYEAREMAIHDEVTRTVGAREEGLREGMERGIEKGIERGIEKVALNLLDILDDETIALKTGLLVEEVRSLRIKH